MVCRRGLGRGKVISAAHLSKRYLLRCEKYEYTDVWRSVTMIAMYSRHAEKPPCARVRSCLLLQPPGLLVQSRWARSRDLLVRSMRKSSYSIASTMLRSPVQDSSHRVAPGKIFTNSWSAAANSWKCSPTGYVRAARGCGLAYVGIIRHMRESFARC